MWEGVLQVVDDEGLVRCFRQFATTERGTLQTWMPPMTAPPPPFPNATGNIWDSSSPWTPHERALGPYPGIRWRGDASFSVCTPSTRTQHTMAAHSMQLAAVRLAHTLPWTLGGRQAETHIQGVGMYNVPQCTITR